MAKKNTTEEMIETPIIDEEDFDDEEGIIVEMSDEEGNVYYYSEEMVIPIGDDNFAILVEIPNEEHHHAHGEGCDCGGDCDCGEGDVIIAKIIINEDGEEEYIEPTDEEFDKVQEVYDQILYESDEEE